MNLIPATYKILYNSKDITADITDHLISLSYIDKVEGESDEIELTLQDSDLLWQNAWYPAKGATLQVQIEQAGLVLNCGTFTLDEIEMQSDRSSGDTISIRGLAAAITKKLRTKRSTAHENKSLREIVNTIAAANGLTVTGIIANITFDRKTQYQKTDLRFLKELAEEYGYTFSIRGTVLTFTDIYQLEARNHVLTIDKTELLSWSMKDKTAQVFKAAKVKRHNPNSNETIDYTALEDDPDFTAEDVLEIKSKAENKQQAEAKAKAALHKKNTQEADGSVSVPGNTLLVAGNNFELTGMGSLSGINHILTSTHSLDRGSGYVVSVEVKRIKKVDAVKWKPKAAKKKRNNRGAGIGTVAETPTNLTWGNAANAFTTSGAINNF